MAGLVGRTAPCALAYRCKTPGKGKPQLVLKETEFILQVNPFILLRHCATCQRRASLQAGGTIKRWVAIYRHAEVRIMHIELAAIGRIQRVRLSPICQVVLLTYVHTYENTMPYRACSELTVDENLRQAHLAELVPHANAADDFAVVGHVGSWPHRGAHLVVQQVVSLSRQSPVRIDI